jgi:hypothetical protein
MRPGGGYALFLGSCLLLTLGCGSRYDLSRSDTQVNVGVRAAKANLWREALFRFQRAVQIDPANAMAHNNLAVAYEGIGDFEKARASYVEALRLDRGNAYIQKNYSRFVEFSTKNKKRERKGDEKGDAAARSTESATPSVPATTPPETPAQPKNEPPGTPEPPASTPGTAPENPPVPTAPPPPPPNPGSTEGGRV